MPVLKSLRLLRIGDDLVALAGAEIRILLRTVRVRLLRQEQLIDG